MYVCMYVYFNVRRKNRGRRKNFVLHMYNTAIHETHPWPRRFKCSIFLDIMYIHTTRWLRWFEWVGCKTSCARWNKVGDWFLPCICIVHRTTPHTYRFLAILTWKGGMYVIWFHRFFPIPSLVIECYGQGYAIFWPGSFCLCHRYFFVKKSWKADDIFFYLFTQKKLRSVYCIRHTLQSTVLSFQRIFKDPPSQLPFLPIYTQAILHLHNGKKDFGKLCYPLLDK